MSKNNETISNRYCPTCDNIIPHLEIEFWTGDGWCDVRFRCNVCNILNNGFDNKYSFESEEYKRKRREYAREYRRRKEKERRENNLKLEQMKQLAAEEEKEKINNS